MNTRLIRKLLKLAKKFTGERWKQTTPKGQSEYRDVAKKVKQTVHDMMTKMSDETRKKYEISNPKPIGTGLNGFVFESTDPKVVIKATFSPQDAKASERLMDSKIGCLPEIHAVVPDVVLYDDAEPVTLIYMERLKPLPLAFKKTLENLIDSALFENARNMGKKYQAKDYIKAVEVGLTKAQKGSKTLWLLGELDKIFKELVKAGEWQTDLHSDNFMLSADGKHMKMVDVGMIHPLAKLEKYWKS